uniref:KASH domain-containing protein n=1 Tax=Anopheles dirus TaxID=7168 RepID=A0A182NEA9_9DIPT
MEKEMVHSTTIIVLEESRSKAVEEAISDEGQGEKTLLGHSPDNFSPTAEVLIDKSSPRDSNANIYANSFTNLPVPDNNSEKELAEIYRTLQQSYLSLWQLRDAEKNFQLQQLDAKQTKSSKQVDILASATYLPIERTESLGDKEALAKQKVDRTCMSSSELEVIKCLSRSILNDWQLKEAELRFEKLRSIAKANDSGNEHETDVQILPVVDHKDMLSPVVGANVVFKESCPVVSQSANFEVSKGQSENMNGTIVQTTSRTSATFPEHLFKTTEDELIKTMRFESDSYHDTHHLRDGERKLILLRQVETSETKINYVGTKDTTMDAVQNVLSSDNEEQELVRLSVLSKVDDFATDVTITTAENVTISNTPLKEQDGIEIQSNEKRELNRELNVVINASLLGVKENVSDKLPSLIKENQELMIAQTSPQPTVNELKNFMFFESVSYCDTHQLRDGEKQLAVLKQLESTVFDTDNVGTSDSALCAVEKVSSEDENLMQHSVIPNIEKSEPEISDILTLKVLDEVPCLEFEDLELTIVTDTPTSEALQSLLPENYLNTEAILSSDKPLGGIHLSCLDKKELSQQPEKPKMEELKPIVSVTNIEDTASNVQMLPDILVSKNTLVMEEISLQFHDKEEQELNQFTAISRTDSELVVCATTAEQLVSVDRSLENIQEVPRLSKKEDDLIQTSTVSKADGFPNESVEREVLPEAMMDDLDKMPCVDKEEQGLIRRSEISKAEDVSETDMSEFASPVVLANVKSVSIEDPLDEQNEYLYLDMEEQELIRLSKMSKTEDEKLVTVTSNPVQHIEHSVQSQDMQQFVIQLSVAENKQPDVHNEETVEKDVTTKCKKSEETVEYLFETGDDSISSTDASRSDALSSSMASVVSKPEISFINIALHKNMATEDIELMVSSIESNEGVFGKTSSPEQDEGEIIVEGKLLVQVNIPQKATGQLNVVGQDNRKKEKKRTKKSKQVSQDSTVSKDSASSITESISFTSKIEQEPPTVNVWELLKGKKTYAEVVAGKEAERRRLLQLKISESSCSTAVQEEHSKMATVIESPEENVISRNESFVEVELRDEADLETFIDTNKIYENMIYASTSWANVVEDHGIEYVTDSKFSSKPLEEESEIRELMYKNEVSHIYVEGVDQMKKDKHKNSPTRIQDETTQKKKTLPIISSPKDIDPSQCVDVTQPMTDEGTISSKSTIWQSGPLYAEVVAQNFNRENDVPTTSITCITTVQFDNETKISTTDQQFQDSSSTIATASVSENVSGFVSKALGDVRKQDSKKSNNFKKSRKHSDAKVSGAMIDRDVVKTSVDVANAETTIAEDSESDSMAMDTKDNQQSPDEVSFKVKKSQRKHKKKPLKHATSAEASEVISVGKTLDKAFGVPLSESLKEIAHLHEHGHDNVEEITRNVDEGMPSLVDAERHVKFSVEIEILKKVPLPESPKEIEHLTEHKPSLTELECPTSVKHIDDIHNQVHFVHELAVVPSAPPSESVKEFDRLNRAEMYAHHTRVVENSHVLPDYCNEELALINENATQQEYNEKRVKFDNQVEILPDIPFSESSKETEREECVIEVTKVSASEKCTIRSEVVDLLGSPNPVESEEDKHVKFDPWVEVLQNVQFSESVKEITALGTEKESQRTLDQETSVEQCSEIALLPERRVSFSKTVVNIELEQEGDDGFEGQMTHTIIRKSSLQ